MNSHFKFPRRVRIHGGECGAVARALHHKAQKGALTQNEQTLISDEKAFSLRQADSGKALESTFTERKQMSTKTFFKRISLVAATALGAGSLSVIAVPAANAAATISAVTVGTIPASRPGAAVTIPIYVNLSAIGASGDTVTIAAQVISAPTSGGPANGASLLQRGSTANTQDDGYEVMWFSATGAGTEAVQGHSDVTPTTAAGVTGGRAGMFCDGSVGGTTATTAGNIDTSDSDSLGCNAAASMGYATASATDYVVEGWLNVKPDIAGTYSVLVSATSDGSDAVEGRHSFKAGDKSVLVTFTTGAAPATVTLAAVGGSSSTVTGGTYGSLIKVTIKDAAGNASTLTGTETIDVTSAGLEAKATKGTGVFTSNAPTSSTSASLNKDDFIGGVAFVNVKPSSTGTTTVTATGAAGLSSSITASLSISAVSGTTHTASRTFAGNGGTVVTSGWDQDGTTSQATATATTWYRNASGTSSTLEFTFADPGATALYGYYTIEDEGAISALPVIAGNSLYFERGYTTTDDVTYHTLTFTHSALGDKDTYANNYFTVTESGDATAVNVLTIKGDTAAGDDMSVSPSSIRADIGGSTVLTATILDQFAAPLAGASVSISVVGRNSARAAETKIADADGRVQVTITDSGTTGTSDVVTFTSGDSAQATITYGTTTVGSVLLTTTNTTSLGVDEYPVDPEDISAGDGAEAGVKTVTATVKDANGVVLAGVPVTFTISGTGAAVLSTKATVITGAAGTASSSVYAWIAGTYTVTATAGGVSDTAPFIAAQETDEEARTISASVSGNRVTATVKDRFGNVVTSGVNVVATVTAGSGVLGSSSTATAATDTNGNVTFVITGGSATVKLAFESTTYGQTDAIKGNISSPTSTDVFTAYTAGTALDAEEGVGASYDAAGVNSVSVEVTFTDAAADAANAATDAAAEAIDAANAATDAANLAAEAADAATVAAEEARDAADAATAAVEELATQVATLMAALKAQITTLANTVAKIAKKVKA